MSNLKQLASLVCAMSVAVAAQAAPTLVHDYQFNGNLNDSVGSVALQSNFGGTVGSGVFSFGANQGPTLVAESSLSTSYSIGLVFNLQLNPNGTSLDGNPWQSIVNLSNLASDSNNQYLFLGHPNFYNFSGTATDGITSGVTADLLLTWDGSNYRSYLNGTLENSFTSAGAANATIIGGHSVFQFFQDDGHSAESTPGNLYDLRVWNGALTGDAVHTAFAPLNNNQNQVPDAGSTIALFAAALGLLGFARRRWAPA